MIFSVGCMFWLRDVMTNGVVSFAEIISLREGQLFIDIALKESGLDIPQIRGFQATEFVSNGFFRCILDWYD